MQGPTDAELDAEDEIFTSRLAMYADPDYWAGKASGNGPIPLKPDPGLRGRNPAEVAQELAQDLIDVLTWQEAIPYGPGACQSCHDAQHPDHSRVGDEATA